MGNDDNSLPPWFSILRQDLATQAANSKDDINGLRKELSGQIQNMVTQDAFNGALKRYDDKIADLGSDIVGEAAARKEGDVNIIARLDQAAARKFQWKSGQGLALVSGLVTIITGVTLIIVTNLLPLIHG